MSWKYWTGKKKVESPFIFEINTANTSAGSTSNTQFSLPFVSTGTYNCVVDWGDSTSDLITTWDQAERTHTYSSTGTYTITITGICRGWSFANTGDRLKMLDISQWGVLKFTTIGNSTLGAFRGCANMDVSATAPLEFDVPQIAGFFNLCPNLIGNSSFSSWDVSNITNMNAMFSGATNFNQDISSWDVSNVTTLIAMFQNAVNFNQDISSWNVSKVINTSTMFFGATNFNQDISSWDVSNVLSMASMFRNSTSFNQNIGSWNVSKVNNFNFFMLGKSSGNFSASNLDAIYNGWSTLTFVNTGLTIDFGSIKYTSAGQAGKNILTSAPNNWTITDGGI